MKASAQSLEAAAVPGKGTAVVLAELVKARLTGLVLITTGVGYYLGSRGPVDLLHLLHVLGGTGLVASGAAALNQWMERDLDALMHRTQDRPLPSGRLSPGAVLWGGLGAALAGLAYLLAAAGLPTALVGAVTLLTYLLIYTPLKTVTPLNTVVGAVPGALPPLLGWTASRGMPDVEGWSLFAILAFWQLPHFLAIAWMYREDYARAGFAMLPQFDPEGRRTAGHALAHTLGLLAVSLAPVALGLVGALYLAGALVLGGFFLWRAVGFAREVSHLHARRLFFASIVYLPLLLLLMALDKN